MTPNLISESQMLTVGSWESASHPANDAPSLIRLSVVMNCLLNCH